MGWGRLRREGTNVHLELTHIVVWHKQIQHCKAVVLQLKNFKAKNIEKRAGCEVTAYHPGSACPSGRALPTDSKWSAFLQDHLLLRSDSMLKALGTFGFMGIGAREP